MINLKSKEREQLLQNANPVEYIVTMELDNTLSEEFFQLMRPFQWLHERAKDVRNGTKNNGFYVSYVNAKGRHSVTWYKFILSGLPHIQKGLIEVLNIKDDVERTSEMIRLEALVRLLCNRTSTVKKRYDEVTEEMILSSIETTKRLEPPYDEEQWGIELKSVFGFEATTVESQANDYNNVLDRRKHHGRKSITSKARI